MIDEVEKSVALIERMQAALPVGAFATTAVRETMQQRSKRRYPRACRVTAVSYLGDEGDITCTLDFGLEDTKEACIVSITHLRFERKHPLAREIAAYCKHRIKRLKKIDRRMVAT